MSTNEADLLRAACCVAGLDGEVCSEEESLLRKLKEHAGVGEASFRAMLDRARDDPNYYEDVLEVLRGDGARVLRVLVRVAEADGEVTTNERVIIRHLAERVGVDAGAIDSALDDGGGGGSWGST